MTKEGIKKCLRALQVSYPNTYKGYGAESWRDLASIWEIQFHNCEDEAVFIALNKSFATNEFPPSYSEIKKNLVGKRNELSNEDIWALLLKAGRNGLYHAEEEYAKLPESVRKVVTPGTIKEIAMADDESLRYIKRDIMNDYRISDAEDYVDRLLSTGDDRLMLGYDIKEYE